MVAPRGRRGPGLAAPTHEQDQGRRRQIRRWTRQGRDGGGRGAGPRLPGHSPGGPLAQRHANVDRDVGLGAGEASGSGTNPAKILAPSSVQVRLLWASWQRQWARRRRGPTRFKLAVAAAEIGQVLKEKATKDFPRLGSRGDRALSTFGEASASRSVEMWCVVVRFGSQVPASCFLQRPRQSGGLPQGFGCFAPPITPLTPMMACGGRGVPLGSQIRRPGWR